jgi:hypothetical protein
MLYAFALGHVDACRLGSSALSIWVRSNLVMSCLQSIKVRKLRNRLLALRNRVSILSTTAFNGFSFALLTEESSTIYVDRRSSSKRRFDALDTRATSEYVKRYYFNLFLPYHQLTVEGLDSHNSGSIQTTKEEESERTYNNFRH